MSTLDKWLKKVDLKTSTNQDQNNGNKELKRDDSKNAIKENNDERDNFPQFKENEIIDDKVEVCDQRVAVCRDHANSQCRRKLCKYYHIPVALPPANIMATIFNQQPAQQPLQPHQQLPASSAMAYTDQQKPQLKKQQLTISTNTTRSTSELSASLTNHNYNTIFVSSFNNNIPYEGSGSNSNTTASKAHEIISHTPPRQVSSTINSCNRHLAVQGPSAIFENESSNITDITTSATTTPTTGATTASSFPDVAISASSRPTLQRLLKTQPILASSLGYYDLLNYGFKDFNTNCIPLVSSNPTYVAAPILYPSAAQTQHQISGSVNVKSIQMSTSIMPQQAPPNASNITAITTSSIQKL